jgi:hypothetical protein
MRARFLATMVAVAVSVGATAHAVPLQFDLKGATDPTLTAHVQFAYNPGLATIAIDIKNTTGLPSTDPRLTGFAFNVPAAVTGVSSFTGPTGWEDLFDVDDINTPMQLGFFDLAGITGNSGFNGGFPNDGIPADSTFHFEFVLSGAGLGSLNETSFLSLLSLPGNGNPVPQYFVARFQRTGANEEGSDVAIPTGDPTTTGDPVPEPGTFLLLGSGLAGLWRARRKRA